MRAIPRRALWVKAVLALVPALFYLLFQLHYMQQFLDWDQVWYLNHIIDALDGATRDWFNPHHLYTEIGGKTFHQLVSGLWGAAGFRDVPFNVRLHSLVAGCAGLFFCYLFIHNLTSRHTWSLLGVLAVAFAHGYLVYSTKADTGIFPLAGMLATLWALSVLEKTRHRLLLGSALTGLLLFLGVMYHQYMVLACIAVFVAMLVPQQVFAVRLLSPPFEIVGPTAPVAWWRRAPERRNAACGAAPEMERRPAVRLLGLLIMTLIGAGLSIGAYLFVGRVCYKLPFHGEAPVQQPLGPYAMFDFQDWLFCYEIDGRWGAGFKEFDVRNSFRGITNAFLSPTGVKYLRYSSLQFDYDLSQFFSPGSWPFNVTAVFMGVGVVGTAALFPLMWRRYRRSLLCILVALGLFSFFTSYWEPLYFEFWLIPAGLISLLAVMVLNLVGEHLGRLVRGAGHVPLQGLLLCYLLTLAPHNIIYFSIPYSQERHIEDIVGSPFSVDQWNRCFSYDIFRHPDDPYRDVRTMPSVRPSTPLPPIIRELGAQEQQKAQEERKASP